MEVYITRLNGTHETSTSQYMQRKTAEIAYQLGYREMGIYSYKAWDEKTENLQARLNGIIAGISAGDIVVCQFPTWNELRFDRELVKIIKLYRAHVAILVHDFEPLMAEDCKGMLREIVELYNQAEVLIVPSYALRDFLRENGVRKNMKFVIQEIWDYPTDIYFTQASGFKKEIHFTGNPKGFVFPNQWDYDIPLKVYSYEICTGQNVQNMGWMNPSELLLELAKGGFGLVWYGNEDWHQYMRYNNSTKLSTYLAAGIPVIVPRGISNQYLIEGNHLGLAVESLEEAAEKVKNMAEEEYKEYVRHVAKFAILLRDGYFTRRFVTETVHQMIREDLA